MTSRLGLCSIGMLVLMVATTALGQGNPWRSSPPAAGQQYSAPPAQTQPYGPPAQPNGQPPQPYGQPSPDYPSPRTRPATAQGVGQPGQFVAPGPPGAPPAAGPAEPPWWKTMTPQDHANVDRVLKKWEACGEQVKMFESRFVRRAYEPDRTGAVVMKSEDLGVLKYQKPDKGLFEITGDPKKRPEENQYRAEKYVYDGQSIYLYNFLEKTVTQKVLPPGERGKPIGDGPVPFVFGSKAEKMKQRYWIRVLGETQDQVRLEAWPRHQDDAADFRQADVILATSSTDMRPIGIRRIVSDGQKVRTADGQIRTLGASYDSYMFYDTVINPMDPLRIRALLQGDPFTARMESGWKKVVEPAQPMNQAAQPTGSSRQ